MHERAAAARGALARTWRVDLIQFNQVQDVEEAEAGVLAGLRESGLVEGRDYVTTVRNAQGDMATVSTLIDAALGERADLLMTFSTPTLQAALAAGAARADRLHLRREPASRRRGQERHRSPAQRHRRLHGAGLRGHDRADPRVMPSVHSLGTLFVPAEVNSVFNRDLLEAACRKAGLELIDVPANTSSDVPDAAWRSRPAAGCDLPDPWQPDGVGVPDHAQAAARARLPVFAFQTQPGARRRRRDRRRATTRTPDASRRRWRRASCAASGPRTSRFRPWARLA